MQNGIKIYSGIFFPTYVDKCFPHWPEWNHSSTSWKYSRAIQHYASAFFVNGLFWNDSNRVLDKMKMEGHRSIYINSYMSYIEMRVPLFLYLKKYTRYINIHMYIYYLLFSISTLLYGDKKKFLISFFIWLLTIVCFLREKSFYIVFFSKFPIVFRHFLLIHLYRSSTRHQWQDANSRDIQFICVTK